MVALGFMLDKDTASETLGSAISGIKDVASSVIDGAVDVVGGAAKSVFSNFLWLIPVGIGGYLLWDSLKDDNKQTNDGRSNVTKTME